MLTWIQKHFSTFLPFHWWILVIISYRPWPLPPSCCWKPDAGPTHETRASFFSFLWAGWFVFAAELLRQSLNSRLLLLHTAPLLLPSMHLERCAADRLPHVLPQGNTSHFIFFLDTNVNPNKRWLLIIGGILASAKSLISRELFLNWRGSRSSWRVHAVSLLAGCVWAADKEVIVSPVMTSQILYLTVLWWKRHKLEVSIRSDPPASCWRVRLTRPLVGPRLTGKVPARSPCERR